MSRSGCLQCTREARAGVDNYFQTGAERLKYHQEHSKQCMNELKDWCINIIDNKEAEPNSILSTEIMYLLNHRDGLTSFLSIEGAELDNNQLEQKLRLSVLNRKNWLFLNQN